MDWRDEGGRWREMENEASLLIYARQRGNQTETGRVGGQLLAVELS